MLISTADLMGSPSPPLRRDRSSSPIPRALIKRIAIALSAVAVALVVALSVSPDTANAGTSCGGFLKPPCGIVYNRTSGTLELSRDSASHLYCAPRGPYRDLPAGRNSNAYGSSHWPDVDCFRSRTGWIITNGRVYPPGEWVRIWTSKWVYSF
jgi:hypothetical protein